MIEELQHVPDVLRVLYHKVELHVEFTAHELHRKVKVVTYSAKYTIA